MSRITTTEELKEAFRRAEAEEEQRIAALEIDEIPEPKPRKKPGPKPKAEKEDKTKKRTCKTSTTKKQEAAAQKTKSRSSRSCTTKIEEKNKEAIMGLIEIADKWVNGRRVDADRYSKISEDISAQVDTIQGYIDLVKEMIK